jgi:hypothetical protein
MGYGRACCGELVHGGSLRDLRARGGGEGLVVRSGTECKAGRVKGWRM